MDSSVTYLLMIPLVFVFMASFLHRFNRRVKMAVSLTSWLGALLLCAMNPEQPALLGVLLLVTLSSVVRCLHETHRLRAAYWSRFYL